MRRYNAPLNPIYANVKRAYETEAGGAYIITCTDGATEALTYQSGARDI